MKGISPNQWKQLDTLLNRALELDRENRQKFIDEQSQINPEISTQLKQLLSIHDEAADILGNSVTEFFSPIMSATHSVTNSSNRNTTGIWHLDDGSIIGSYRIKKTLGRGGMGNIYLATRTDDLHDQPVAIKVLRSGLDSEDILRRFRQERQVLASLNHPNIARLIDGGVTQSGRLWFAMEYVDGVPIDEYCNQHTLTVSERIDLFLTVCQSVGYAHQNLVIHRDLKPSNILVESDGTVKLLDFGISKILSDDPEWTDPNRTTRENRFLSPSYAAPEQVSGEHITTACDVFSLGVVLYRLITGHPPYTLKSEISRSVNFDSTPELPSRCALGREPNYYKSLGEHASDIESHLMGDLDTILLMALHTDPQRRYTTVGQFSDDLNRHKNHLPVVARPDSAGYRLGKFIKRHRAGFVASVAAVIVLLGFIGLLLFQQSEIRAERNNAITERDKAVEVAAFLEDLLAASDPASGSTRSDTMMVRDFLDLGADRVQSELAAQPAVQAQMLNVLGNVNQKLGLYDKSKHLLDDALTIRSSLFAGDHPDVAESMNSLGNLLIKTEDFVVSEEYIEGALDMRIRLFGEMHEDVGKSYTALANLKNTVGDYDEAENLYRKSYNIHKVVFGVSDRKTAVATTNLATILQRKGNLDEAEALHLEALDQYEYILGADHPLIATSSNNLSQLYSERGDFDSAEIYARRALQIRRDTYGDEHPLTLSSLNNHASVLADLGQIDEAERLYLISLDLRKKQHGEESMQVAVALNNLAALLKNSGRYASSIPYYQESVAIALAVMGDRHPSIGILKSNLAAAIRLNGNLEEAERLYSNALTVMQETLPADHPSLARTKIGYAYCLTDRMLFDNAQTFMLEGYTTLKDKGSNLTVAYEAFIYLYDKWDKPDEQQKYRELLTGDNLAAK